MEGKGETIQNAMPIPTNPARIYNKSIIEFIGNKDDLSAMLLSAERYALGRATYIVNWTCEVIARNLNLVTLKDKKVMIRDIKNASYLGWECDIKEWNKLLAKLENAVETEES